MATIIHNQQMAVAIKPRTQCLTAWQAQWEQMLSQPDNQPLPILPGDWIVEHPSGWIEKLTQRELDERYERVNQS